MCDDVYVPSFVLVIGFDEPAIKFVILSQLPRNPYLTSIGERFVPLYGNVETGVG